MITFLLGIIAGMIIGRILTPKGEFKQCPAEMYGYYCKGQTCDHSDSAYYEAKLAIAKHNEGKL